MAFSVEEPVLLVGGEVAKGFVEVDADFRGMAFEVLLAFVAAFALEGFDAAVADGEGGIGDGLLEVDADDASEATAFGASAEGVVEGEEGGGGLLKRSPAGGEGVRVGGVGGGDLSLAFAEAEGCLEGLKEA